MGVPWVVGEARPRKSDRRTFPPVPAHALREPLVGMHVIAALLNRRTELGVKEREMVRLLDDGVQRATSLVDSILEYATAADDAANRTEVACGEVVGDVLAALASQIDDLDARVEVAELPTLHASRPGLFRVFQNLIANALKFRDDDAP